MTWRKPTNRNSNVCLQQSKQPSATCCSGRPLLRARRRGFDALFEPANELFNHWRRTFAAPLRRASYPPRHHGRGIGLMVNAIQRFTCCHGPYPLHFRRDRHAHPVGLFHVPQVVALRSLALSQRDCSNPASNLLNPDTYVGWSLEMGRNEEFAEFQEKQRPRGFCRAPAVCGD